MPTVANAANIADSTSAGLTDTGLSQVLKAGYLYRFDGAILLQSAATTTGPAIALDTPASPTIYEAAARTPMSTTAGVDAEEQDATNTDADQMTFTTSLSTGATMVEFSGFIVPSVAGELKVQFNTEVNGSAVTYKGGTFNVREIGLAA